MSRFLLVCTAIFGMAFLMACQSEPETVSVEATSGVTAVALPPSPTTAPTQLPPPAVSVADFISPTLVATLAPSEVPATDTPVATDTPLPTDTPPPTATFAPLPTLPPTNTPTPLPTPNTFGLSANFLVEGGPTYAVNQDIWFQFDVKNPNGAELAYGALGLYPRKDGIDRLDLFQYSWTNATMFANGFTWRDHINIPEPGQYTVRIAICFDTPASACQSPAANWVTISPYELPITVQ